MVRPTTLAKALLGLALTLQPALSAATLGVDITQFSGENCEAAASIAPVVSLPNGDCTKINTAPGKSFTVASTLNGGFFCRSSQQIMLMVWKESDSCGSQPDSTIGPFNTTAAPGTCVIGQIRSAKLACIGDGSSPLKARTVAMPFEG